MGENRKNVQRILGGNLRERGHLEDVILRREYNIKMDIHIYIPTRYTI